MKNRSGDVHIPLLCKATPEAHTSFICRLSSYISAAPYTSMASFLGMKTIVPREKTYISHVVVWMKSSLLCSLLFPCLCYFICKNNQILLIYAYPIALFSHFNKQQRSKEVKESRVKSPAQPIKTHRVSRIISHGAANK